MGPAPYGAEQTCKLIIEVIYFNEFLAVLMCFSEPCNLARTSSDLSYIKQATKMCNLSYNFSAK